MKEEGNSTKRKELDKWAWLPTYKTTGDHASKKKISLYAAVNLNTGAEFQDHLGDSNKDSYAT